MEYLNGILFHKSGPDNKQHTNQPIGIWKFIIIIIIITIIKIN